MRHYARNIPAAISMQTSGSIPKHHEIYDLAIVLLDPIDLTVNNKIMPFQILMRPDSPENWTARQIDRPRAMQYGIDQISGIDMLDLWFESLNMPIIDAWPMRKRLIPICANWPRIHEMLTAWLGYTDTHQPSCDLYLDSSEARDVLQIAKFTNDLAGMNHLPYPYDITNLECIAIRLNVERTKMSSALNDALDVAEIYRRQISMRMMNGIDLPMRTQ